MLAYAPRTARSGSPRTLMLVAAGHALALALLLTARSEYANKPKGDPTDVIFIDPLKPPPPPPPSPDPVPPRQPMQSTIDRPPVIVPTPGPAADPIADGPAVTSFDPVIGNAVEPQPAIIPDLPAPAIVRKAARFITLADRVRPPYPASKQSQGEEAKLRISLAIDANGRVSSVTPVGAADPAFLEAARRHILRHWRYQPATEGGTAIASTIVVTLTFTLEE